MDRILMGAWSLSPPPNVPGNTADSRLHCISNENAALTYVFITVTDVFLCVCLCACLWSPYGTGLGPSSDLFVPCHPVERYKDPLKNNRRLINT